MHLGSFCDTPEEYANCSRDENKDVLFVMKPRFLEGELSGIEFLRTNEVHKSIRSQITGQMYGQCNSLGVSKNCNEVSPSAREV